MTKSKNSVAVVAATRGARCVSSSGRSYHRIIEAISDEATRSATLVCDFLDAPENGTIRHRFQEASSEQRLDLLLHIGAMLQLCAWERSGIRPFLGMDLPRCDELRRVLFEHVQSQIANRGFKLLSTVLRVWLLNLAWTPILTARACVAMRIGDRRDLVDQLAIFLWKHRHPQQRGESHGKN